MRKKQAEYEELAEVEVFGYLDVVVLFGGFGQRGRHLRVMREAGRQEAKKFSKDSGP